MGFSITGSIEEKKLMTKTGALERESIILTKPLGTGLILAAEMRGKAKAKWMDAVNTTEVLRFSKLLSGY